MKTGAGNIIETVVPKANLKLIAYIAGLLFVIGCTSNGESKEASVSTVDSNTVGTTDTTPQIIYLDNPKLDSFSMAMDSEGPTIKPQDTQYIKAESK